MGVIRGVWWRDIYLKQVTPMFSFSMPTIFLSIFLPISIIISSASVGIYMGEGVGGIARQL